jgi:hypothetical protein
MSSPTVLTFVSAPAEEARRNCEAAVETYLSLGEAILNAAEPKRKRLRELGISVAEPPQSASEARAKVAKLGRHTVQAVKHAHAFWQSLKHPWADVVDELTAKGEAEHLITLERERLINSARLQEIAAELQLSFAEREPVITLKNAAPIDTGAQVASRVARVIELASLADPHKSAEEIASTIKSTLSGISHAQERLVVIEGLRIRFESEVANRRRALALESVTQAAAERARSAATIQLAALERELQPLGDDEDDRLRERIENLRERIAVDTTGVDDEIEAIRKEISTERARKSVYELVAKTLRRQGYDEVEDEPVQSLDAAAIRRRYFKVPGDADRIIEFAYGDQDALSVEMVRIREQRESDVQADREAQQSICRAMKTVRDAMEDSWRAVVVHEGAVGQKVSVRTDLVQVADRKTKPRAASRQRRMEGKP